MRDDHSKLVYSTDSGRICPDCGHPADRCACKSMKKPAALIGKITVRRENAGPQKKPVTVISGLPLSGQGLESFASELKRLLGTGGTAKDGRILIQGDKTAAVISILEKKGYSVKK
ncbi:stress response translation initiation inhibitor YciH [bacterium]|nr:stress response translation initiation inhibitor YciH [bacterium]